MLHLEYSYLNIRKTFNFILKYDFYQYREYDFIIKIERILKIEIKRKQNASKT
jgi:hypothetical protein